MQTLLQEIVEAMAAGPRGLTLIECERVLIDINYQDHVSDVENVVREMEYLSGMEVLDKLQVILLEHFKDIISEHAMGLAMDDVVRASEIVRVFYNVIGYENSEELIAICEGDGDPLDKFCEVAEAVTGRPSVEFAEVIGYVRNELLERLQVAIEGKQADSEEPVDTCDFKEAKAFITKHKPERFTTLLAEGWHFGYKMTTYLNEILSKEGDLGPVDLMKEYLAAALASKSDPVEMLSQMDVYLEGFLPEDYLSIQELTRVARELLHD
jgi:hypothetical protein